MKKILHTIKMLRKKDGFSFKNVYRIFKSDICRILTSWVTIVILIGLTFLPPVYAWLNIYASWDPYGNTRELNVAVINEDAGGNLLNIDFNIGEEIVSNLKANNKLGWIFCDNKDEGLRMVEEGDVYAAIVIPENFSLVLTTIFNDSPQKPTIEYYINQKMNAIAPKIIDSATNTLKTEISTNIIETAVQNILEKINYIGSDLKQDYPDLQNSINLLDNIKEDVTKLPEKLNNLSSNVDNGVVKIDTASEDFIFVQNTIDDLVMINNNMSNMISDTNENIEKYSPDLRADLTSAQALFSDISDDAKYLSNEISTDKPIFTSDINKLIENLNTFKEDTKDISERLSKINNDDISDVIEINKDMINDIDNMLEILYEINENTDDLEELEELCTKFGNLSNDIADGLDDMEDKIDDIHEANDSVLASLDSICQELINLINAINEGNSTENLSSTITSLTSSISLINNILEQLDQTSFSSIISTNKEIINDLNDLSVELISGKTVTSQTIEEIKNNLNKLSTEITTIRKTLDSNEDNLRKEIEDAEDVFHEIENVSDDFADAISELRTDISKYTRSLSITLKDVQNILSECNTELSEIQEDGNEKIDIRTQDIVEQTEILSTRLNDLSNSVNDSDRLVTILDDMKDAAFHAESFTNTILNSIDDEAIQNLENNLSNGAELFGDINNILASTKEDVDDLSNFSDDVATTGETTLDRLKDVKKKVPEIQSGVTKIVDKVDKISSEITYDDLVSLVHRDVDEDSEYFSSPIELTRHDIYEPENYGKGLAPFYSILALWVGGMFLAALLRTKVDTNINYSSREEYFGKYLLFGIIAIAQGIVTALGDLFILKISVHNPVLFVLLCSFFSLIFSLIIYSLVSTLNNVGKALGIILLLLQVTASGGTFPIQVTPKFFRIIYKYMPFNYGINGLREAIYGVTFDNLIKDVGILLLFGIIFTLYGCLLKKRLNKIFETFSYNLSKSGVIH